LIAWLNSFHACLVSKFALYFFKILQRIEKESKANTDDHGQLLSGNDMMKALNLKSLEHNFLIYIDQFFSRGDCFYMGLVFEAHNLKHPDLTGYECPVDDEELWPYPLTGMRSWPAIFSFPNVGRKKRHLTNETGRIPARTLAQHYLTDTRQPRGVVAV